MLNILKHMGVTAYGPRQRGNLQNPLPLPLTFSAEEKWWTKYASSEAPASDKPWEAVRRTGDSIIEQVPQAFRRCFRQLVDGLSLNSLLLKPYDQGDATSLCRAAYHWIMWCSKAAGQTNVLHRQDIATHSITSEAEGKMSQACDPLHQTMAV